MFCILMKFGTVVDLNEKTRMQKIFSTNFNYLWSYDHLKARDFCSLRFIAHA